VTAPGAVIIGAFQSQGTENTLHLLGPPPGEASFPSAITTDRRVPFIGSVRVKALSHGLASQLQNLLSNCDFQGLPIQMFHGRRPD
jgi:hypothetical protein